MAMAARPEVWVARLADLDFDVRGHNQGQLLQFEGVCPREKPASPDWELLARQEWTPLTG